MKFYNLCDKTFERDFSSLSPGIGHMQRLQNKKPHGQEDTRDSEKVNKQ